MTHFELMEISSGGRQEFLAAKTTTSRNFYGAYGWCSLWKLEEMGRLSETLSTSFDALGRKADAADTS